MSSDSLTVQRLAGQSVAVEYGLLTLELSSLIKLTHSLLVADYMTGLDRSAFDCISSEITAISGYIVNGDVVGRVCICRQNRGHNQFE